MLQAGDSSLPRELAILHRCESTTPHSRATARPYGSEPYSRIGAKNKHFLFQSQFDFLHARVRVAPASQQLCKPAPLQTTGGTPELLMQHTRPAPTTPQARVAAPNLTGPAAPPLLARARAWERIDAALPPCHHTHLRAAALLQRSAPTSPQRFVL